VRRIVPACGKERRGDVLATGIGFRAHGGGQMYLC
jgi:hypothetical protein